MIEYTYEIGEVVTVMYHKEHSGEYEVLDRRIYEFDVEDDDLYDSDVKKVESYKLDTEEGGVDWFILPVIDGYVNIHI